MMEKLKNIYTKWGHLLVCCGLLLLLSACSANNKLVPDTPSQYASDCMSCQILIMIYDAVGTETLRLHETFTRGIVPLMMVSFSIWLALRLFKFVSSVNENNVSEVWNEILRKIFVCMVCTLFAASPEMVKVFVDIIVFPLYEAFLELGLQVLQNSGDSVGSGSSFTIFGEMVSVQHTNLTCQLDGSIELENEGFPTGLRDTMVCMIQIVDEYLNVGQQISWTAMSQTSTVTGRVVGFITASFFWVVRLGFVFYLVDSIFKMGLIILMLPLFIVSYAFGPTKKWATVGLKNILVASAFMMCFSIIIAMSITAMLALVQENQNIFNPNDPEMSMSEISIGFICLLLIGFLIYGSMGVSQQLVSSLIGAKMSANFQKNLKATLQAAGRAVLTGVGSFLSWGASLLPDTGSRFINVIKHAAAGDNPLMSKLNRWAGRK